MKRVFLLMAICLTVLVSFAPENAFFKAEVTCIPGDIAVVTVTNLQAVPADISLTFGTEVRTKSIDAALSDTFHVPAFIPGGVIISSPGADDLAITVMCSPVTPLHFIKQTAAYIKGTDSIKVTLDVEEVTELKYVDIMLSPTGGEPFTVIDTINLRNMAPRQHYEKTFYVPK